MLLNNFQLQILAFVTSALKSLAIHAIWLSLSSVIYSQIAPFFALSCIFLPANEEGTLKQHNQTDFKSCLK